LLFLLLFFLLLFGAAFYCSVHILQWLVGYLSAAYNVNVAILSPMEAVLNIMQLALLLLLIIGLPALLLWAVSYVRPALYAHERRYLHYVPLSLIFGLLGSAFGWYLATSVFLPYFENFSRMLNVQNIWSLNYLLGFVLTNLLVFFLVFQIPLVVIILRGLGFIKTAKLASLRKIVILISVVVGALITPPDAVSQLIVALPFYLLFELSIQYCRLKEKIQAREKRPPRKKRGKK
jgi:sec-independent protein translocase protein TatC